MGLRCIYIFMAGSSAMKTYKCLIADDDILDRDTLEMHLRKIPGLEIVSVCANGTEAVQALMKGGIDLAFSDIEMPGLSGMDLVRSLKDPPIFVFISSHSELAAESYNLDVVDFIVKPMSFDRLAKAIHKAIEYAELKSRVNTIQSAQPADKEDYFFIRESNDLVKVKYSDVAYIESMGNFSKIFTLSDKRHITLVNLKNLEMQLPSSYFTRVHKQYIVNHHHISAISAEELKVAEKYTLPLSQNLRQDLLNKVVNNNIVTRHIQK